MDAGTTLVLVGTHTMTREGLKLVFEATGRMTVVGETGCPEEAVRISDRVKPDILVIDFVGQGARALRAIQRLRARKPETNVLVLTDPEQQESLDTIIEVSRCATVLRKRTVVPIAATEMASCAFHGIPTHGASTIATMSGNAQRRNAEDGMDLASAWRAHFRTKWYCGRGSLNSRFQPLLLAWLIAAAACDRPAGTDTGLPGGAPFLERDSAGVLVATTPGTRARAPVGWVVDTVPEYQIGEVEGEDPYLFSRIEGVQQLSDGRVVILDRANCELRFFGSDSVFLEHRGGRGEGPGEFQPNSSCDLEPSPGNDSLYVHSHRVRSTVSLRFC